MSNRLTSKKSIPDFDLSAADVETHPCIRSKMIQEFSNELARNHAAKMDELVSQAITNHLGHADWSHQEVLPRLQLLKYGDSQIEWITMDGQPIFAFAPIDVLSDVNEAGAHMLRTTQGYKILNVKIES